MSRTRVAQVNMTKRRTEADYPTIRMLIGGEWRDRPSSMEIVNPADETPLGILPSASAEDLDDALQAANHGSKVWRDTAPSIREEVLLRACAIIRTRVGTIATAMTLEQGKPYVEAQAEVLRACNLIEWDASEGRRLYGRIIPSDSGHRVSVVREPVGVVAAFTPWNFPFNTPARKIGGALAAGCAIILKPAEETPSGAFFLAQCMQEAGVPDGVINIVFGEPSHVSGHLIPSPIVRLVTLTGSVPVGRTLASMAGAHLKPTVMELGGHSPTIICDDVDPCAAAEASVTAKMRNAGQVCTSPTRFYVHTSIYDKFITEFAQRAKSISLGNGMDPHVEMGPLANVRRLEAIEKLTEDAIAQGGRLLTGGRRLRAPGYFYPLTTIADVPDNARAMRVEPFGPLALISPFTDLEDAIAKANATSFGLTAYAFSNSSIYIDKLQRSLECGSLSINHFVASLPETPFGGVKESGFGREGGSEGLEAFTTIKLVNHKL